MSRENELRQQILAFLEKNPHITRLNFALQTPSRVYKVYPQAYRVDIYNAIKNEDIEIEVDADLFLKGIAGKYTSRWLIFKDDTLSLSPTFSIGKVEDQANLIHECTHAHIDNQNIGDHSSHEDEAVGYTAKPLTRQVCGSIPRKIAMALDGKRSSADGRDTPISR
jgi:hypothetical protein